MTMKLIQEALDGGNVKLAGFVAASMLSDYGPGGFLIVRDGGPIPLPGYRLRQHIFTLSATFTAGTAGESITDDAERQDVVKCGSFWVRGLAYTVRRPNYLFGSAQKAQSDADNSLNPNVDINLNIENQSNFLFTKTTKPIELIARSASLPDNSCCSAIPLALVLNSCTDVSAEFILHRALDVDNDEVPYEVTLAFLGVVLGDDYLRFPMDAALKSLRALKVLPDGI